MAKVLPSRSEILAKFSNNIVCSQCVLSHFAEELGYDADELLRMSAAYGGGMEQGDTCGAVAGALTALSLAFYDPDDPESRNTLMEKVQQFYARFNERWGSPRCKELLGYNFSVPGEHEKAAQSGIIAERCPNYVISAIEILSDLLAE